MKKIIIALIVVAILGGASFYAYKSGHLDKFFNGSIKDTPTVIESIKNISELTTACFYEEIIQSEPIRRTDSLFVKIEGSVRAGFKLDNLTNDNISIEGDSLISIIIPEAQIFDVIVNPSNVTIIEGEKNSSEKIMNRAITKAKKRVEKDAINDGILEKATESGKKQLTELFKTLGFKEVYVDIE